MFTASAGFTVLALVALFICRKAIKHSFSVIPSTLLKTSITADKAITSGYNTVLMEVKESTVEMAKKLNMDENSTTDDVFWNLSGIDPQTLTK